MRTVSVVYLSLLLCVATHAIRVKPGVHTRIRTTASTTAASTSSLTVETQYGPVTGTSGDGFRQWLGIPFAAPPVGPLRWSAPTAPTPWSTARNTTTYSAGCPQNCVLPKEMCPATTDEDCLYLNVFSPADTSSGPRPVMVFLAGGAFVQGTGNGNAYSGQFLASRNDIVVVTANYRLGALGWLAAPSQNLGGNFGFLDQRFLLNWVQRNIRDFGGDPNQVTLCGESAGAASVAYHMVSPGSEGLFHRGIIESHPWGLPIKTLAENEKVYDKLLKKSGCENMDCLRNMSAQAIADAADSVQIIPNPFNFTLDIALTWTPTIDGDLIPAQPIDMWQQGKQHNIPIMIGSNTNEGDMFIRIIFSKTLITPEYSAVVAALFHLKNSIKVLKQYPPSWKIKGDQNRATLSQLATDYIFHCPARHLAQHAVSNYAQKVFFYHFDHVLSFGGVWGQRYSYCSNLVCHGSELPLVFGTAGLDGYNFTTSEAALSEQMGTAWANFVSSPEADPNSGPTTLSPPWPQYYTAGTDNEYRLATPSSNVESNYDEDNCNFWDGLGYDF